MSNNISDKVSKYTPNTFLDFGIKLAIQVSFIFIFLTIFFFSYVKNVEQEEFNRQIKLVVDNIFSLYDNDIKDEIKIIPENELQNTKLFVVGTLESLKQYEKDKLKDDVENVIKSNNEIKNNSYNLIIKYVSILLWIISLLVIFSICFPIKDELKNALLVLFAVAIVEYSFLNIIAKNYTSVDPNKVRRAISMSIINHINNK